MEPDRPPAPRATSSRQQHSPQQTAARDKASSTPQAPSVKPASSAGRLPYTCGIYRGSRTCPSSQTSCWCRCGRRYPLACTGSTPTYRPGPAGGTSPSRTGGYDAAARGAGVVVVDAVVGRVEDVGAGRQHLVGERFDGGVGAVQVVFDKDQGPGAPGNVVVVEDGADAHACLGRRRASPRATHCRPQLPV